MGKWDGYFDINEEDGGMASWELPDPEGPPDPDDYTDEEIIADLMAQLEAAQVRISGLLTVWHTPDVKPSALEPVQGWYGSGVCGYPFHRIVQWEGIGWIALYDHKPCSPPDRWAYLPKFETEVTR